MANASKSQPVRCEACGVVTGAARFCMKCEKSAVRRTVLLPGVEALVEQPNRAPPIVDRPREFAKRTVFGLDTHLVARGELAALCGEEPPARASTLEPSKVCMACRAEASRRNLGVR